MIDLPAANRRSTPPKRQLVASALRLHLQGKTPKEERRGTKHACPFAGIVQIKF
jgi:hypothetical protein